MPPDNNVSAVNQSFNPPVQAVPPASPVLPSPSTNPGFSPAPGAVNQPQPNLATPPPPPVQNPMIGGLTGNTRPPLIGKLKVILFGLLGLVIILGLLLLIKSLIGKTKKNSEVTLTWWGLWEEERVIAPIIQEFEKENPKIKIRYVKNSPQDYRERLANSMAKGQAPDIFEFHNTWVPMFVKEMDRLPETVMAVSEYAKKYYPVVASDSAVAGGGLVGIPMGFDALTLFINNDIFSRGQLEPPKTWVELRQTAKSLTTIENGQIVQSGVALGKIENVDHWQDILGLMLIQNRANLSQPEGVKVQDALKFYCLFSSVDKVWNETLPPSTSYFATGKLAMYFGPAWRALNIKELNPDLNFKTVPLPQLPKEDPNEADVSYANYWMQGVWGRSANKKTAWQFLSFLTRKESLEKMYQTASVSRGFGQAYPLVEMNQSLVNHDILGSIINLAPNARSWYLASRTFDGPTGINSQISKYFEDATNTICAGVPPEKSMEALTPGVQQVLKQYGLIK